MFNKKIGKVLKKIRLKKKMTQSEFYQGVFSRSTASRIENGVNQPTYQELNAILNHIDISITEFDYIFSSYESNETLKFIQEFVELGSSTEVEKLQALKKEIIKKNGVFKSEFLDHLCLLIEAIFTFQHTQSLAAAEQVAKPIWKDLSQKDSWFYTDILLIANSFYLFDDPYIPVMFDRLLKELQPYKNFAWAQNYTITVPLNYCVYLKRKGKIEETEPYLDLAEKAIIKQPRKDILYYFDMLYKRAELEYFKGNEQEAKTTVKDIFKALDTAHESSFRIDLQEDWAKYVTCDLFTYNKKSN